MQILLQNNPTKLL